MKKNILLPILGMVTLFFATSCSKSDNAPPPPGNTSPQGNWVGTRENGGPSFFYALNFQANGTLVVSDKNPVTPDIATGTWSLFADSVRATYTFAELATTYSIAGKYTATSNVMNGTIGLGTNTSGAGVFSVTKQ